MAIPASDEFGTDVDGDDLAAATEGPLEIWDDEAPHQFRHAFHEFISFFVYNPVFNWSILVVILVNVVMIALAADRNFSEQHSVLIQVFDLIFLSVYSSEALLKIYANPKGYFTHAYDIFDLLILCSSFLEFAQSIFGNFTFLRVLRTFRALRALRAISFFRSLQIIVSSLVRTLKSIINLVVLLFLGLYILAVVGYYFFAGDDPDQWGNISTCLLTLHIYVTADGWTDAQNHIASVTGSIWFTIVSVFFLSVVFTNLFIGAVLQALSESRQEAEALELQRRSKLVDRKKALIMARQQQELERIFNARNKVAAGDIQKHLSTLAGKLRHDDVVPMQQQTCSATWLLAFVTALHHQENTIYRIQQVEFELAETLAEMMEHRLQSCVFA